LAWRNSIERRFEHLWEQRISKAVWYSATATGALIVVGELAFMLADYRILGRPLALRIAFAGFGLASILAMYVFRIVKGRESELRFSQAVLAGQVLLTFPVIWLTQAAYRALGQTWTSLYGFQAILILVATLRFGKRIWINFGVMAAFLLEALALLFQMEPSQVRFLIDSGYFWSFLLAALVSVVVLVARTRFEAGMRRLIYLEVRAAVLEKVARTFLAVSDRGNSPLQTLEIGLQLLKRKGTESELSAPLLHALGKLEELHQLFRVAEEDVVWALDEPDLQATRLAK
jgi:hypothetical protein